jgi:hypothetical protein
MERSGILLDKAKIDAEAVVVAADALAYEKRVIIAADNALTQKLQTEENIQTVWADAFARRSVPQTVWVTGGGTGAQGVPKGDNNETEAFMKVMTGLMAERLNYERGIPAIAAPAVK